MFNALILINSDSSIKNVFGVCIMRMIFLVKLWNDVVQNDS